MSSRKAKWNELNPDRAFWLFVVFATLVFLLGGGSRYDIASIGPLRAIAGLFLIIAIWFQTEATFKKVVVPISFILALAIWMIVQLIPLPHSLWSSLNGREDIVRLDQLIGFDDISRSISLSTLRTLNSLASLIVPLTALMLAQFLDAAGWRRLITVIVVAGLATALLGIAQVSLRGVDGLYFYEITNSNNAVGFFSNRNHNALFLNIALLCSVFRTGKKGEKEGATGNLIWLSGQTLLIIAILINGSRFGLALLAGVGVIFAVRAYLAKGNKKEGAGNSRLIAGAAALLSLGLITIFAALERIPAIERIFGQNMAADQRAESLPYSIQLAIDNFPYGAGFGAFEQAYRAVEPVELLSPTYFNHAHNDWLQLVIEGGLPGVLLLVAALAFLALRLVGAWRRRNDSEADITLNALGFSILALFALHSVVDYPIRTPSLMVVAVIAFGMAVLRFPVHCDARLPRGR